MRHVVRPLVAAVLTASLVLPAAVSPALAAGAATHFTVSGLIELPAGTAQTVTVTALDATNVVADGYAGTITFSGGGAGATLPLDYAFQPGDNGVHTFNLEVTLLEVGPQTVTMTDSVDSSITGSQGVNVDLLAGPATQLVVTGLAELPTGTAQSVTVTARDATNAVANGYTGTITFTGGGVGATLPVDYTFVPADNGVHTFILGVTLLVVGSQTVTATDTVTASITGSQTVTVDPVAGPATQLVVTGLAELPAGTAQSVTVTARDASNLIAITYVGTITFTGGGPGAALPPNYTFVPADNGVHTFNLGVTLATAGSQTVTATDTVTASITGFQTVTVDAVAGPATHLDVTGLAELPTGTAQSVTITARDAANLVATGYVGTITFSGGGAGATLPGDYTFVLGDSGVHTFVLGVTLLVGGPETVTATDTVTGSITGSQTVTVDAPGVPPPPNQAPKAVADSYVVKQGSSLSVDATAGVLANDTDVDTPHALLTAHVTTSPAHGTFALAPNGSFVYTPTPNYVGPDSFTYRVNDGLLDSALVTVSINIYLNHAPIAVNDILTVVAGSPATPVAVLANDNAINQDTGEILTIVAVTRPAHGATAITGGGTGVNYRPAAGFTGTDLFSYTISDGQFQATGSVLVRVPRDTFGPTATGPAQVVPGQSIGTSTVSVRLTWSAKDRGSGVRRYELQQRTNSGAYTAVNLSSSLATAASRTLRVGSTYRFRVRAIDKRGNVGGWAYGPTFLVIRSQEASASFSGTWTAGSSTSYSGGTLRSTVTAGDTATFSTTGRTLAWVAVRGPGRGLARILVDGVLATTLDLSAASTSYRFVAFSRTFPTSARHTLAIVHVGAPTTEVDVDAFVVLR